MGVFTCDGEVLKGLSEERAFTHGLSSTMRAGSEVPITNGRRLSQRGRSGHDEKEGPVSGLVVPPANHRASASGLMSGARPKTAKSAVIDAVI